jgi:cephalosporin hydroxylase
MDSNHTYDHVARQLELYAPLVHKDTYLIVATDYPRAAVCPITNGVARIHG